MEEEIIPEVKLERLCINPDFKFGEIDVRFGISDFGKGWDSDKRGFFVKKGNELKVVDLRGVGLEHELYMPKECLSRVQCMQVHQNQKDKNKFGIIFGMSSGCCDGAVLGGIYSIGTKDAKDGNEDEFEIFMARRVPFGVFGVAGRVYYGEEDRLPDRRDELELFALGAGCAGCGVQYLHGGKLGVEQEYIYQDRQLKIDEHILNQKVRRTSYDSFQNVDSLSIANGILTAAYYANIEEAYRVKQEYYTAKEMLEKIRQTESNDAEKQKNELKESDRKEGSEENKKKSNEEKDLERKISYIDSTISRIRLSVSQSSFINRNLRSVYP